LYQDCYAKRIEELQAEGFESVVDGVNKWQEGKHEGQRGYFRSVKPSEIVYPDEATPAKIKKLKARAAKKEDYYERREIERQAEELERTGTPVWKRKKGIYLELNKDGTIKEAFRFEPSPEQPKAEKQIDKANPEGLADSLARDLDHLATDAAIIAMAQSDRATTHLLLALASEFVMEHHDSPFALKVMMEHHPGAMCDTVRAMREELLRQLMPVFKVKTYAGQIDKLYQIWADDIGLPGKLIAFTLRSQKASSPLMETLDVSIHDTFEVDAEYLGRLTKTQLLEIGKEEKIGLTETSKKAELVTALAEPLPKTWVPKYLRKLVRKEAMEKAA